MTVTLTYDDRLSRVRVDATGLPAGTVTALLERRSGVMLFSAGAQWTTVRGGGDVPVTAGAFNRPVDDYEFAAGDANTYRVTSYDDAGSHLGTSSASITPVLSRPWLKVIARPFLNRPVTVYDYGEVTRAARGGVHNIIGRTVPVVVSDVRGGRRFDLELLTETDTDRRDLDYALASGEPVFMHMPADCDVPGGYFHVDTTSERRTARRTERRVFRLPLTEVAAPAADIVGATSTWETVLNTYPTWQDVLNAHATWGDLLELIGSPEDVIVG